MPNRAGSAQWPPKMLTIAGANATKSNPAAPRKHEFISCSNGSAPATTAT